MRNLFVSIIVVMSFGTINAQSIYSEVLNYVFAGNNASKEYFKGQFIKGKRNGMGCLKEKNGMIYIGDFSKNLKSGIGMLFSPDGKSIKNCEGAVVYTGGFKDGKKNGRGCCYASNGDLIYEGTFLDDKPADTFPLSAEEIDINRYFSVFETDNYSIFIGEVSNRTFTGQGVVILEDGELFYGMMTDNNPSGVVLHVLPDEEWNVVNIEGDEMITLSTSERYKQLEYERAEINRSMRRDLMEGLKYFAEGASTLAQLVNDVKSKDNAVDDGDVDTASESSSGSGSSKKSKVSSGKSKSDCGSAWISDSRSYANYDSQLADMDTYPEKYDASDRSRIRSKMKSIREKWESRGCVITKSSRE